MVPEQEVIIFTGDDYSDNWTEIFPRREVLVRRPDQDELSVFAISFYRHEPYASGYYLQSKDNSFEEVEILTTGDDWLVGLQKVVAAIREKLPHQPKILVFLA